MSMVPSFGVGPRTMEYEGRVPQPPDTPTEHGTRSDEERRLGGLLRFVAAITELTDDHCSDWILARVMKP